MIDFKVNSKCIKCAQCVKDCPAHIIEMDNGFPYIKAEREEECYQCQHCLAICPTGAISILGKSHENSLSMNGSLPEFSKLELLTKGRRSIRKYKKENVEKELLKKLLSTALHAPTGVNAMDVDFFVVDDKEVMDTVRTETYKGIAECVKNSSLPEGMEYYNDFLKEWEEKGADTIFRNAPHMLIAAADHTSAHTPLEDSVIALSYFEMLAVSAGLGTVWCGLAKRAFVNILPYMIKKLGIPENYQIEYIMMFGKPAVKFLRTVQKNTDNKIHTISLR